MSTSVPGLVGLCAAALTLTAAALAAAWAVCGVGDNSWAGDE